MGALGVTNQMGNVLLERDGWTTPPPAQGAAGDHRQGRRAAQVKEQTHRQAIFDEARVALAKNDVATARTRAAAYSSAVSAKQIPFEVRQSHELAGPSPWRRTIYPRP